MLRDLQIVLQKDYKDREGGESIHNNLMCTLGCRKRDISTEPNSDAENVDPADSHCLKHHKKGDSDMHEFREMVQESECQREKFEGKIIRALQESTKVYETMQKNLLNVLNYKLN
jgi:hypothetical protein